ncbi:hypothetical protein MKEN_01362300 [Mycena kentingensis (nom. inval.)]|nr:hypothetical protein MKEN_01362300 [Mycena kentingensis (nom. inval.)]
MSLESDLPGGDDFEDVTSIFVQGAAEMQPGEILFRDGFTLHDAMSAFEIGEPRLDSGMVVHAEQRPPFDPWAPLLPQEICWIIDRAFSYEMLFHEGNPLAHTVFTCLYALVIPEMHPDYLPSGSGSDTQLIALILRASICGLLKCCDLSWRELSKGYVYDTEDWQSDKCETSLLEGISVQNVLLGLDGAIGWLVRGRNVPEPWLTSLIARLNLRKTLLQLMNTDIFKTPFEFGQLLALARNHLQTVQTYSVPEPAQGSSAYFAFDPYIARRLNSSIPIRVIPLPPPSETWAAIEALLDGWEELRLLSSTNAVATWEIAGCMRGWLPSPPLRVSYIRSSTQSLFYDGLLVLNKFSPQWMFDRFFFETLGISNQTVVAFVENRSSNKWHPWADLQRGHFKLITEYIRALWYNPPRKRRFMMKLLVDLHTYYARMVAIQVTMPQLPATEIMAHLPGCVLFWRLSVIRDLVFSGFQLELYAAEERAFAYWYLSQVIDTHLACLDDLLLALEPRSTSAREARFQHSFLTALQAMTLPMYILSMPLMSFAWRQMHATFRRRYKWAFSPSYELSGVPVVAEPDFERFMYDSGRVLRDDLNPRASFALAGKILKEMVDQRVIGGYAGLWAEDRVKFLRTLLDACTRLSQDTRVPESVQEMPSFDEGLLRWDIDPGVCPSTWFPVLEEAGKERRRNRRPRVDVPTKM